MTNLKCYWMAVWVLGMLVSCGQERITPQKIETATSVERTSPVVFAEEGELTLATLQSIPNTSLGEVPSGHSLSMEGIIPYDKAYLYTTYRENTPTVWEVYGFNSRKSANAARQVANCDRKLVPIYLSNGETLVSCEPSGTKCSVGSLNGNPIIIICL